MSPVQVRDALNHVSLSSIFGCAELGALAEAVLKYLCNYGNTWDMLLNWPAIQGYLPNDDIETLMTHDHVINHPKEFDEEYLTRGGLKVSGEFKRKLIENIPRPNTFYFEIGDARKTVSGTKHLTPEQTNKLRSFIEKL